MAEIEKIKERYKKRKNSPEKSLYSYFNPGNLFIIQERQRKILKLLDKYGMKFLDDKKIIDIGCGRGGGFGILSNGEQGQKIYMALIYLKKEL